MNEATSPIPSLTRVVGGENVPVTFENGEKGEVFVRKLRLKNMLSYLVVMNDHAAMIALFIESDADGRKAGSPQAQAFVESLTDESQLAILKKGQELNLPLFESWYPLHLAKSVALRPAMIKEIEQNALAAISGMLNGSASNGSGSTSSPPTSSREQAGATEN